MSRDIIFYIKGRGTGRIKDWISPPIPEGETVSGVLGIHKSSSNSSENSVTTLMEDREIPAETHRDPGKDHVGGDITDEEFRRRHDNMMA